MQAIITKYYGPTNSRGSRIVAKCESGLVSIPYPHELSGMACHKKAAMELSSKLGLSDCGELLGGYVEPGVYCFVFNNLSSRV